MNRILVTAALMLTFGASSLQAQQTPDTINRKSGKPQRGTVTEITQTSVTVKPGISDPITIDANDIIHLAEAENRVSLLDLDGKVLGRWGEKGDAPGQFVEALHGAWMDSHEDFYICEVPFTPNRLQKFERIR